MPEGTLRTGRGGRKQENKGKKKILGWSKRDKCMVPHWQDTRVSISNVDRARRFSNRVWGGMGLGKTSWSPLNVQ